MELALCSVFGAYGTYVALYLGPHHGAGRAPWLASWGRLLSHWDSWGEGVGKRGL